MILRPPLGRVLFSRRRHLLLDPWPSHPRLRILPHRQQRNGQGDAGEGNGQRIRHLQSAHVSDQNARDLVRSEDRAQLSGTRGYDQTRLHARSGRGNVGEKAVGEGGFSSGDEEGAADGLED